jgi:hypothetical protein
MAMQTDVLSVHVTGADTAVEYPTRVRGLYIAADSVDGTLQLIDGGASGDTLCTLDVVADSYPYLLFPGEGVRFEDYVYVDATEVTSVTVFYG